MPEYSIADLTRTVRTKVEPCDCPEHADDPCWVWTGACDSSGYAAVKMRGTLVQVHRYTHERMVGPIELPCDTCRGRFGGESGYVYTATMESIPCSRCASTGLDPDPTVDHLCQGHRNCINPTHFEIVSRSENSRRANERRWGR